MLRVRLLRRYADRDGAAFNIGELLALDDRRAADLIRRGIAEAVATPAPPAAVITVALSEPPVHRMMEPTRYNRKGERIHAK